MSNQVLLNVASQGSPGVEGTPINLDGSHQAIHIQADSFGTDGKVVLKVSPNYNANSAFVTMEDQNTISGLAEYSSNSVVTVRDLPAGWQIRADLVITTGTFTNAVVIMG
jgi:hypothetical protein